MSKRARKTSSAMDAVRAASRGDLEDLLEKLVENDPKLEQRVVAELTAARAPAKPRVAETSTLTVGGTGAFDKLNETLLLDVLLRLKPHERLESMSACKGWLALRKDPTFWPALQFRTRQVSSWELPGNPGGGLRIRTVSPRTLNKLVGPARVLPPLTNLVSLDVQDSTSNKHGIGAADWSQLLRNLRVPPDQLRELSIRGKVFKITFYKACAKLFGSGLRELRVGVHNGGVDWGCISTILASCPRLAKLTIPARAVAAIDSVNEDLRKARGGGAAALESLTIEADSSSYGYGVFRPADVFSTVQRHFPEISELRTRLDLDASVISSYIAVKRLAIRCRAQNYTVEESDDALVARAFALAQTITASCPKLESLDVAFETSRASSSNIAAVRAFLQACPSNALLRELRLRNVELAGPREPGHVAPSVIAALIGDVSKSSGAPRHSMKLDLILGERHAYGQNGNEHGSRAHGGIDVAKAVAEAAIPKAKARPDLRVRVGYIKPGGYDFAKKHFFDMDANLQWL